MKKIIFFILFIIIVSCNDKTVTRQIENATLMAYSSVPKIKAFSNVKLLKAAIEGKSGFEITKSKPRLVKYQVRNNRTANIAFERTEKYSIKNGYDRWKTPTQYEEFGVYSLINNGCKNTIAYNLYGKEKDTINEINIILKLYAPHKKEEAFSRLANNIKANLNIIDIDSPMDLNENILKGDLYYYENELCYLMLNKTKKTQEKEVHNTNTKFGFTDILKYDEYTFIIKSK